MLLIYNPLDLAKSLARLLRTNCYFCDHISMAESLVIPLSMALTTVQTISSYLRLQNA